MYGKLALVCGPMFSGKTTELLKRILWASNGEGQRIAVFKPAQDHRYSKMKLVSHEGLSAEAEAIFNWQGRKAALQAAQVSTVFFDEVQFFTQPQFDGDVVAIIQDLLESGIHVVTCGLDMDWQGEPFEVTAFLAAMAEEVIKQKSVCVICGRPASRTFKKGGSDAQVEIGGHDLYDVRCLHHWSTPDDTQVELFEDFSEIKPIKVVQTS